MSKRAEAGIPALQNDEVTGMTENRQEEIIERSGQAPRKDAAEQFLEEQGEQAGDTSSPRRDRDR